MLLETWGFIIMFSFEPMPYQPRLMFDSEDGNFSVEAVDIRRALDSVKTPVTMTVCSYSWVANQLEKAKDL